MKRLVWFDVVAAGWFVMESNGLTMRPVIGPCRDELEARFYLAGF